MTDIIQLFSGIGVVIDEAVNAMEQIPNGIQKITQSIESNHIPLLKYENIPELDTLTNLHSISFLILDWNLSGIRPIPEATVNDNVEFIKRLHEICFVPLFIFSDEDPHAIENPWVHHDSCVDTYDIVMKSGHLLPPELLDVLLKRDSQRTVVPCRGKTSVDLA